MDASRIQDDNTTHIDTPYGIFTADGRWFHIREERLRTYAAPVLDELSLEQLLQWADRWLRSPRILAAWLLPLVLWTLPLGVAVGGVLVLYVLWTLLCPSVVSETAARMANWLDTAVVQGLYYVLMLSILAAQERFGALAVGLGGFVLLRWGLLERGLRPLLRPTLQKMYPLPVPDQVLRALIVRVALNRRVSLPQIDALQETMLKTWNAHRNQS